MPRAPIYDEAAAETISFRVPAKAIIRLDAALEDTGLIRSELFRRLLIDLPDGVLKKLLRIRYRKTQKSFVQPP